MDISIIYGFEIEQLWELFRSEIKGNLKSQANRKILDSVKKGNTLHFDIGSFIRGEWKEESIAIRNKKTQKLRGDVVITIENKRFNKYEFYEEIDDRLDLMRNWLKENWANTGLGTIREGGEDNEK